MGVAGGVKYGGGTTNALARAQQLAEQAALTEAPLVIIRRQAAEAAGELGKDTPRP